MAKAQGLVRVLHGETRMPTPELQRQAEELRTYPDMPTSARHIYRIAYEREK
jgi:hypothetical protein